MISLLDHGYLSVIETWGSDERIIEAARMSTGKGFLGWGTPEKPGDEKLLRYLYENRHSTPFEMAGMVIEVQAPIFVFREWHRHRTQCLGPDTLVHFDAPKSRCNRRFVYKMRIEDVWKKWQPTTRSSRPERQTNPLWPRSRIQAMQLRCADEEQREIGHTRIVDVIKGEPKPMIRVTAASGRQLTATRAHKVLTSIGWATLGEAVDRHLLLMLEGTTRGKLSGWETPPIDETCEKWRPIVGWAGTHEVSDMGRVRRFNCQPKKSTVGDNGYLCVSLNRPGEQVLRTVHGLVMEAFIGPYQEGCKHIRHADDNRQNARLTNLSYGNEQDNADDRVRSDRQQRLVGVFEEIVDVQDVGLQSTYDISVEGPWHNFIAEGFVVHNSYNEMSARYVPLPDVNYIPSVERLMTNAGGGNRQAGTVAGAGVLTESAAESFQIALRKSYAAAEALYQEALSAGVPKELARIHLPVGRYSRMRASANLRNWLAFLTLRHDSKAQFEIRTYAEALSGELTKIFPRTMQLFIEGRAA